MINIACIAILGVLLIFAGLGCIVRGHHLIRGIHD